MSKLLRLFLVTALVVALLLNSRWSSTQEVDWKKPINVAIYPINADNHEETQQYIDSLSLANFTDIADFFQREGQKYRLSLSSPVSLYLADQPAISPPEPPDNPSILENIIWGFRMRYWVWSTEMESSFTPDVRVYLRLYSTNNADLVRHSLGLQKGLIGVVNGLADATQQGQNNLVAVHELLHTLGASDKYDPKNNWPIWPDGYAEPTKEPLLPQTSAEIMGGRVQISHSIALLPPSLEFAVVGAATAIEIGWLR